MGIRENNFSKSQLNSFTAKSAEQNVKKKGSRRTRIVNEILRRLAMGRNERPHLFDLPTASLVPEKPYTGKAAPIAKSVTSTPVNATTLKKQNPRTLTPFTQAPIWVREYFLSTKKKILHC